MKLLFLKLILFFVTSFVLINLIAVPYGHLFHSRFETPGSEVYDAIKLSRIPSSNASLVLGDSVCHQLLLHAALKGTLNLATNQAISVCGQYLLARSTLDHDSSITQITLAYLPVCFDNDLQQKFTFNYFVKPFYTHAEFRREMSPRVNQLLDRHPTHRLMAFPMFQFSNMLWATDYSQTAEPPSYTYLAPISIEYLHKLSELCDQRGIRLRIVSSPISSNSKYSQSLFLKEIADAHLEKMFAGYIETIRYVDPGELIDGVHFKPNYIDANSQPFSQMLGR